MSRYTIAEFVEQTKQRDRGQGFFELESPRMLEVNLNGLVWTKMGSMVAYVGQIKFTREGMLEHGVAKFLKRSLTSEGTKLTKAEGQGRLYLADEGKKVTILNLQGETIFVNGNDVLAFQDGIEWDITMMRKVAGMLAGGLFNVKLAGSGMIAITTHYDPLTLRVTPDMPVLTDPNATVAWSGSLAPEIKTDVSFKTFLGRGSGEIDPDALSGRRLRRHPADGRDLFSDDGRVGAISRKRSTSALPAACSSGTSARRTARCGRGCSPICSPSRGSGGRSACGSRTTPSRSF